MNTLLKQKHQRWSNDHEQTLQKLQHSFSSSGKRMIGFTIYLISFFIFLVQRVLLGGLKVTWQLMLSVLKAPRPWEQKLLGQEDEIWTR